VSILIALFAVNSGVFEGVLWQRKGHKSFNWNEHLILVSLRFLFVSCIIAPVLYLLIASSSSYPIKDIILDVLQGVIVGVFMFSFFHRAAYNYTVMKINPRGYPFHNLSGAIQYDKEKKGSEKIDIKFKLRIVYLIIGSLIILL